MTVWIGTDWHLVDYNYKANMDLKSPNADKTLTKYRESVGAGDLFIFLGDLCHKLYRNEDELCAVLEGLPGYKVMILGNHDTMPESSYYKAGFDIVCNAASFGNLLFTHKPVYLPKEVNLVNIHGHLHDKIFKLFDNKHINPYGYCHGTIITLRKLLAVFDQRVKTPEEFIDRKPDMDEMLEFNQVMRPGNVFDLSELIINGPDGKPMDETASKCILDDEMEILNDLVFGFDDVYLVGKLGRPDGKPDDDAVLEK